MVDISRRQFIQSLAAAPIIRLAPRIPRYNRANGKKLVILGIDGAEPSLLEKFVAEGVLPNFAKLFQQSKRGKLQTTLPPQSPVAWSSFVSGTRPAGHGIFDFIHRDPKTLIPYLSTSKAEGSSKRISVGNLSLPVSSGSVHLMRRGRPFYDLLEEAGIPTTMFALPANFPVVPEGGVRALSGMGTPDLLGGYGTFTYFSEEPVAGAHEMTGGRVVRIALRDHEIHTKLEGPPNDFLTDRSHSELPVVFTRDPSNDAVKIKIADADFVMQKGQWSEWIPLRFSLLSVLYSLPGMVRFYVKDVHPFLKIYCSPINLDPMEPVMPIDSPRGFAREVAQKAGRFYTQGFPADMKGLSSGVLSDEEYFAQAKIVLDENFRILEALLSDFSDGLLFFYFSSIDQNCHMLWRLCDPSHPQYNPNASEELKGSIRYFYKRMDEAIGLVRGKLGDSVPLLILSDHGFSTFTREFNLNTWLNDEGFLQLTRPRSEGPGDVFDLVDWSTTKAYGVGFNGLYLNLAGREPNGIVRPEDASKVKADLIARLRSAKDPKDGAPLIREAYDSADVYKGPFSALAPDIVLGFYRGYRTSDDSVLGKFPDFTVGDRTDKWAADHCFDPALIPGVLISTLDWNAESPAIWDLAPSILHFFGLQTPSEMEGRNILA